MTVTAESKKTLLERKALLEKGPLNWTDDDIARIAAFTPVPAEDLRVMRRKMQRASEWSIRGLTALDELIHSSPDPARLRKQVERSTSVKAGIERAKTYTGLFQRAKEQLDLIDGELKRK